MVREVEELGAELQPARAAEDEILEQRDVPLRLARVVQDIAAGGAERARRRRGERRRIEPEVVVVPVRKLFVRAGIRIPDEVVRLPEAAIAHTRDVVGAQH